MSDDNITVSYVIRKDQAELIKRWAAEDNRTFSYIVREIIDNEARRRAGQADEKTELPPPQ